MSARIGRNDPCPCGSGKKFKKCHAGEVAQQHEPPSGARRLNLSLDERNDLFLDAIEDIFGLRKAGTWDDVKRRVTRDRVLALYQAHNALWAADDPGEVLPTRLDGFLTSLFVGKIEPEELAQRIFRFGLYTGQILVPNPFTFPSPHGRHPLDIPEQYLRDTLKMVYFMARIAPWIRSGFVQLIGDPVSYDATFRSESMRKAEGRMKKRGLDPRDLEGVEGEAKAFVQRMLGYLPPSEIEKSVARYMPDMEPERRERIVVALKKNNAIDPLALPSLEGRSSATQRVHDRAL